VEILQYLIFLKYLLKDFTISLHFHNSKNEKIYMLIQLFKAF